MGWAGKAIAAIIAMLCIAAMIYLNRASIFPAAENPDAGLNPQYIACRDERVSVVRDMLKDGVINDQQFGEFSARAEAMCASQFPPEAVAKP